jgi:hypothetical protein
MKRFVITLIISALIITGIWIIPNRSMKMVSMDSEIELDSVVFGSYYYIEPSITEGEEEMVPEMAAPLEEERIAYSSRKYSEPFNWQGLITWLIGSLNGLFGMILLVKKIFTKT